MIGRISEKTKGLLEWFRKKPSEFMGQIGKNQATFEGISENSEGVSREVSENSEGV